VVATFRLPGTYELDTLCSTCAKAQGLSESHRFVVLQDDDLSCSCCGEINPSPETELLLSRIRAEIQTRVQRAARARLN